ncbi:MAG: hypothetical protein ABIP94_16615, partial [Planctomycetota bacterium]
IDAVQSLPGSQPNDLLIGGQFIGIEGQPANSLATRIGSTWNASNAGLNGAIRTFAVGYDGAVYAGGQFANIDGQAIANIARWDGSTWLPLGTGVDGSVSSIAVLANRDVYAAGQFTHAGGPAAAGLARWNGTTWSAVLGAPSGAIKVLTLANGSLLVGGNSVARFDGASWQPMPGASGIDNLIQLPDGTIAASGGPSSFPAAGRVALWNGSTWNALPLAHAATRALGYLANSELVVAGPFFGGGSIRRWDGTSWQPLGQGLDGEVLALAMLPNGDLIAGGDSLSSIGLTTRNVVRWNGQSWQALQNGITRRTFALGFNPAGVLLTAWGSDASHNLISRLASDCPAGLSPLGAGCPGSGGANRLTASEWPMLGGSYRVLGQELPTQGLFVEVFGVQSTNQALQTLLPAGQPGCTLLVAPDFLRTGLLTIAPLQLKLSVPATSSLVGMTFHHQLVPFEINTLGVLVATTASNALTVTIGSFP